MATFENTVNTRTNPITAKTEPHTDNRSDFQKALDEGRAYAIKATVTPTGTNDNFLYVENKTGSGRNLRITSIKARCASADFIHVVLLDSVTDNSGASPTALTPRALGTAYVNPSTFIKAESDPDISTITSSTGNIEEISLVVAATDYYGLRDIELDIAPGGSMVLMAETGTAVVDATVWCYLV